MRVYSEDFTHPSTNVTIKDKILYDEKEKEIAKNKKRRNNGGALREKVSRKINQVL